MTEKKKEKTEFEKFCDHINSSSLEAHQGAIDKYVAMLNSHVLVAEELRGRIKILRDLLHARILKK